MFQILMTERDDTVGNPDATNVRSYLLDTVDTLPHAISLQREHENRLHSDWHMARRVKHAMPGTVIEHYALLVDRKHPHEYGNIYRTISITVTVKGHSPREMSK